MYLPVCPEGCQREKEREREKERIHIKHYITLLLIGTLFIPEIQFDRINIIGGCICEVTDRDTIEREREREIKERIFINLIRGT